MEEWIDILLQDKFSTRTMYNAIKSHHPNVGWRKVFYGNTVRPRALCTLWLAGHNRLATKDKLCKFSFLNEDSCCFCRDSETIQHLLFACEGTKKIWEEILNWIQVDHKALSWNEELSWIM